MPANEDTYTPADETVWEVWVVDEKGDEPEWQATQASAESAYEVAGVFLEHCYRVEVYETTRKRIYKETNHANR